MRIIRFLFGRLSVTILLMLIEIAVVVSLFNYMQKLGVWIYSLMLITSAVIVIKIFANNDNPAFKLTWVLFIMIIPVFGGIFYLMWGNKRIPRSIKQKSLDFANHSFSDEVRDARVLEKLKEESPTMGTIAEYVDSYGGFPLWEKTEAEYYPLGDNWFPRMAEELKKANNFIFLEYFIITDGKFWHEIHKILQTKIKQNIKVYLIYDDVGCINTLPSDYCQTLKKEGFNVLRFNTFHPRLSAVMNYRDHRKITVIDGKTAFCGGANIADEYINTKKRFGHWKDTAVMIKGNAVWNFTETFIKMWNFSKPSKEKPLNIQNFRSLATAAPSDGFCQPFSDSPLDNEYVAKNVILNVLNKATDYVYLTTPYLVLDHELLTALRLASKNGVDIRIITPHIPDKKYVYKVTQSFYLPLLEAGVRVFEYTPGFIHAKNIVADDSIAVVGTINLDYRSLYFHFECGTLFYNSSVIDSIKEDFILTEKISNEITFKKANNIPVYEKIIRAILRVFAPIM